MGLNLTQKIIQKHLKKGDAGPAALCVDQVLVGDDGGDLALFLFEAAGGGPVSKGLIAVASANRTFAATSAEQAEWRRFVETFAARHGLFFAHPAAGSALEIIFDNVAAPGRFFLGSDRRALAVGAVGALALAAEPLDLAAALVSGTLRLAAPKVVRVRLSGVLPPWVSGFDVGLDILRRLTAKGGAGRVLEFAGEGLKGLDVADRAAIARLSAECGAAAALFPSDERTRDHLAAQGRRKDWSPLAADADAAYDEFLDIDVGLLEPLVAKPHASDNVCSVREVEGTRVNQVVIGADCGASLRDLLRAAAVLKECRAHPDVDLVIAPGSRAALRTLADRGALGTMLAAGARVAEGIEGVARGALHVPAPHTVSLRTVGRNVKGSAGTIEAMVYLCGVDVAVASAVKGAIADPRSLGRLPRVETIASVAVDTGALVPPAADPSRVEVRRAAAARAFAPLSPVPTDLQATVVARLGDDVATSQILPPEAADRADPPNASRWAQRALEGVDPGFVRRALEARSCVLVAGERYGQGSRGSLEAAVALRQVGVQAVLARSFGEEHLAALAALGVVPLVLVDRAGYDRLVVGDVVRVPDLRKGVLSQKPFFLTIPARKVKVAVKSALGPEAAAAALAGGALLAARGGAKGKPARAAGRKAPRSSSRSQKTASKGKRRHR